MTEDWSLRTFVSFKLVKTLSNLERKLKRLEKWLPPPPVKTPDYSRYACDPIEFIEEILRHTLTDAQKLICESVRDRRETNVQASHGVGKTFLSADLAIWWVYAAAGLCITTAPTFRQVTQLLWGEVRKTLNARKLPGDRGRVFVRLSESARAFGFTASDTNSNAFQGIHQERLLVIMDEACGVSQEIDDGAASCVTGAHNRLLRVGNPIQSGNNFEKACKRKHIRIPVWQHPNVSWAYELNIDGIHRLKPAIAQLVLGDDGVLPQARWPTDLPRDVIPGAVSISWIEDVRAKYGEGSVYWQSRVEGLFPEDSAASIVPRSWFLAARARYDLDPEYWDELAAVRRWSHGLDVGDGVDPHAIASWRGPVLYQVIEQLTQGDREDVTRAAGLAKRTADTRKGLISVDRIGVGSGALAILLEQDSQAVGVGWGESASDDLYLNLKAQQFWILREACRKGDCAIAPLGEVEEQVADELAAIWYEETSNGKIRIEDKKKTIRRLGHSPNMADACVLGFSGISKNLEIEILGKRSIISEIQMY